MDKISWKEIEDPYKVALAIYQFCCNDLAQGFNYEVSKELYNNSMKGIGSDKYTKKRVKNE